MAQATLWYCSVYVISDGHGNMKFGVAKDIASRMKTLQIGNAHPLQLLFEVPCSSPHKNEAAWGCYRIEHEAHKALSGKRMTGEWFAVDYYDALDELHVAVSEAEQHPAFRRYQIRALDVVVHKEEHEHVWYWPTSDVDQRGLIQ